MKSPTCEKSQHCGQRWQDSCQSKTICFYQVTELQHHSIGSWTVNEVEWLKRRELPAAGPESELSAQSGWSEQVMEQPIPVVTMHETYSWSLRTHAHLVDHQPKRVDANTPRQPCLHEKSCVSSKKCVTSGPQAQ